MLGLMSANNPEPNTASGQEAGNDVLDETLDPALQSIIDDASPEAGEFLVCRACQHPVCHEGDAIHVLGSFEHVCTNPAGITFEIGCFRRAMGCSVQGESHHADSWFPGRLWRFAGCERCDTHLGWHFDGDEDDFFGLILTRLTRS